MDIIFNCPNCDQELAVDSSGAGTQIECPACSALLTIPSASGPTKPATEAEVPTQMAASAITSSAAAKVAMHLKVPVRDKPTESLITKPKPPLEVEVRGAGKKIKIRTIRRSSCIESGHDHFDQRVAEFLNEVGEKNIVKMETINYETFDVGLQKIMTDYGLMIIYRA